MLARWLPFEELKHKKKIESELVGWAHGLVPVRDRAHSGGRGWLWAEPCVHLWNSDLIKIVCKLMACMQLSVHSFRKKILFRTSCLHFILKHCCDLCVFFPPAAYTRPAQLGFLTIKNILFASLLISPTCCSTGPSAWHPFALAHVCLEQRFCICVPAAGPINKVLLDGITIDYSGF